MPNSKNQQDAAANTSAKPYPISQVGDDRPRREHKNSNERSATKSPKANNLNDPSFDPLSSQNMLLGVVKHHKATLDAIKKQNSEIVAKLHETTLSNADNTQKLLKVQKQLQDSKRQVEDLMKENDQQLQQINDLEEKCIVAKTKCTALETSYAQKVDYFNILLSTTKTELVMQQKKNENLQKQLEIVQQSQQKTTAQLEGVIQEKDNQLDRLEMQFMQLLSNFSEATVSYDQDKLKLEQKLAAASQVAKTVQAEPNAEFAHQSESLTHEVQSTLKKLIDTEKHCDELQQLNQDIPAKASNTAQCLQIEMEQQKLMINELSNNNRDMSAAYATEKMALNDEIKALKQANEQLMAAVEAKAIEDQQELNKRQEQTAELKNLEQQNLHFTKLLSAENLERTKQLQSVQEAYEMSRTMFRDRLKQKDDNIAACNKNYAEMERQKNRTIAELKLKSNKISEAFDQPIGSGRHTKKQENNMPPTTTIELQKDNETETAEVEASTSVVGPPRNPLKRTIYQYISDFNTDDDQESDWTSTLPKTIPRNRDTNKSGKSKVKRVRRLTSDDIDEVKFSKVKRL